MGTTFKATKIVSIAIAVVVIAALPAAAFTPEKGAFDVELNGTNIHYVVSGDGPVVMAMPNSWGLSHDGLRALLSPLEERFTMIYFDPRGMGKSGDVEKPEDMSMQQIRKDLEALRVHLGLGPVNLIGWSNGGMNVMLFLTDYPDSVKKAVIVHSSAHFGGERTSAFVQKYQDLLGQFARFGAEMAGGNYTKEEAATKVKRFDLDIWFPYMVADKEKNLEAMKNLFEGAEFSWPHAQYSQTIDGVGFNATENLRGAAMPLLFIAGAHDMAPPEWIEEDSRLAPDSRFVRFDESGHFAPLEERDKFVTTVAGFFPEK